jgi:hypothetical protein
LKRITQSATSDGHPTDLGCIFPRSVVKDGPDRQQSARLRGILARLANRRTSPAVNSVRTAIASPVANDPPFATLNDFADDL